MKKVFYLILILSLFACCGPKQEKVEKYMENGVEVIVNHIEPYKIRGEPSSLILEEEFTIDTEKDEIAKIGLNYIWSFDVDSAGSIYFRALRNPEHLVFKFDKNGNFIKGFGHKGQGPGEFQSGMFLVITSQDEIILSDPMKIVFFSREGNIIKEIRKDMYKKWVKPLRNGNYLVYFVQSGSGDEAISHYNCLRLYDSEFNEIKEIDRVAMPNSNKGKGLKMVANAVYSSMSNGHIYVGNNKKNYEVHIYDLNGNLLRKIKKEYRPVPIPEEHKKEVIKTMELPENRGKKFYFPKHMPPFQSLFTDDEGRLFIRTYEKEKDTQEYIYDIFNPEGLFIGRASLKHSRIPITGIPGPLHVTAKNNRLYCLREKDSGYSELVVYKMRWE